MWKLGSIICIRLSEHKKIKAHSKTLNHFAKDKKRPFVSSYLKKTIPQNESKRLSPRTVIFTPFREKLKAQDLYEFSFYA